jgi:hypothetical protein
MENAEWGGVNIYKTAWIFCMARSIIEPWLLPSLNLHNVLNKLKTSKLALNTHKPRARIN